MRDRKQEMESGCGMYLRSLQRSSAIIVRAKKKKKIHKRNPSSDVTVK